MPDDTTQPDDTCDHGDARVVPVLIAISESDLDKVVLTIGPTAVDDLGEVAAMITDDRFVEQVRELLRDAKEQIQAARLAIKAKMN